MPGQSQLKSLTQLHPAWWQAQPVTQHSGAPVLAADSLRGDNAHEDPPSRSDLELYVGNV